MEDQMHARSCRSRRRQAGSSMQRFAPVARCCSWRPWPRGTTRRLFDALARDVRFRFLIPPGPGEVGGAADVAAKYFDWFGDADVLEVEAVLVDPLPDRLSARYRFLLHEQEGWKVVEQQSYLDVDEQGRITAIDLLCSGFRPVDDEEDDVTGTHEFDAGTLSCADGLAQEFRRRILAIPLGDVLVRDRARPRGEGRPTSAGSDDGPRGAFDRDARRRAPPVDGGKEATMSDKLIFNCTHGKEDPERATLPFVAANIAATAGQDAVVLCTIDAVWLGTEGGTDGIAQQGLPVLSDLYAEFVDNGGQVWLCGACTKPRGITEEQVARARRSSARPRWSKRSWPAPRPWPSREIGEAGGRDRGGRREAAR